MSLTIEGSVVEGIVSAHVDPAWAQDAPAVVAVLAEHFGKHTLWAELVPPEDPEALRAEVRARAPRTSQVAARLVAGLGQRGCGGNLAKTGLAALDIDKR